MNANYLDALDKLLLMGVSQLSPDLTQLQVRFANEKQLPDGGFRGAMGGADLYYTDFGVRLMRLLSDDENVLAPTARWISSLPTDTMTVLECFSYLNTIRLLRDCGHHIPLRDAPLIESLRSQQPADGGFARPGSAEVSAYNTFMAALCFQMLKMDFPDAERAVAAIRNLRRHDGGYCEMPGQPASQTNATSAAVAFLTMQDALEPESTPASAGFLASMQTSEGGLLAHPTAPEADLLSTFTGALTLFGLNAMDSIHLPSVAGFAGVLQQPRGGFVGFLGHDPTDVEYTYYGVATLALLRAYVMAVEAG